MPSWQIRRSVTSHTYVTRTCSALGSILSRFSNLFMPRCSRSARVKRHSDRARDAVPPVHLPSTSPPALFISRAILYTYATPYMKISRRTTERWTKGSLVQAVEVRKAKGAQSNAQRASRHTCSRRRRQPPSPFDLHSERHILSRFRLANCGRRISSQILG